MKYLKLFEELNYENSKLTEDEFYDEVGDALELIDFDNFNEKEIEKIRSFVHQIDPKWSCGLVRKDTTKFPPLGIMLNCEWFKNSGGYVHKITGDPAIDIEVIKNTDSWYYVTKTKFSKRSESPLASSGIFLPPITYYKCDQLEGLLETLKEILIYTI
jgi:hypothetical protein